MTRVYGLKCSALEIKGCTEWILGKVAFNPSEPVQWE